jgi:hypothetical protein
MLTRRVSEGCDWIHASLPLTRRVTENGFAFNSKRHSAHIDFTFSLIIAPAASTVHEIMRISFEIFYQLTCRLRNANENAD